MLTGVAEAEALVQPDRPVVLDVDHQLDAAEPFLLGPPQLRVDQTTSIRSYNVLHADGRRLDHVNAYGAKLLRELTRSLRFVKPNVLLMAEDHELWDGVTSAP